VKSKIGRFYHHGKYGLLQDREKALELYTRAAELGSSEAHFSLANLFDKGGQLKQSLCLENELGNIEREAFDDCGISRGLLFYAYLENKR
jgi:TPR repeat protein